MQRQTRTSWQTPLQLWVQGLQHMRRTEHVNAQEMFGDGVVHEWLER